MSRRLIVTADDFGDTPFVNEAVVRAYKDGILRFASLMVKRPHAREAAALAKSHPGLGVGLHLELCAENPEAAGFKYAFDGEARRGLEGEIRSQIEALLAMGIKPTHIDGHINVHVHPVIFPALCRLAREYGIPRVRLPMEEWDAFKGFPGALTARSAVLAATLGGMSRCVRGAAAGLSLPRTWGVMRSGLMSEDYVLWLLERLPPGDTELYFHPTTDPALRPNGRATPSHQAITELETLTSPRVRGAIARLGIELVGSGPTSV